MNNTNITMVAFHGKKKPYPLTQFLYSLFEEIERLLGTEFTEVFEPNDIYNIHATLIGLETDLIDGDLYGHWFFKNRGEKQRIDINNLIGVLKRFINDNCPVTIRLCGYKRAFCTCPGNEFHHWECRTSQAEFHSCGRSAYEGSFYGFSPGPVVCTGWPISSVYTQTVFPHSLYSFRVDCEKTGFLDKYHSNEHTCWMDDDCYIKIGHFKRKIENLTQMINGIREYLSKQEPVIINIKKEDIAIILYKNNTLSKNAVIEKVPLTAVVRKPEILHKLFERLRESMRSNGYVRED